MDLFQPARDLYRDGKLLLDATRDRAVSSDLLRWAREDLEEELLDLKLAVIKGNEFELPDVMIEVAAALVTIFKMIGNSEGDLAP